MHGTMSFSPIRIKTNNDIVFAWRVFKLSHSLYLFLFSHEINGRMWYKSYACYFCKMNTNPLQTSWMLWENTTCIRKDMSLHLTPHTYVLVNCEWYLWILQKTLGYVITWILLTCISNCNMIWVFRQCEDKKYSLVDIFLSMYTSFENSSEMPHSKNILQYTTHPQLKTPHCELQH